MIVTAWSNGSPSPTGAGLGICLTQRDRDQHFGPSWTSVSVQVGDGGAIVDVNVGKPSFWKNCRELISMEIGRWMMDADLVPWERSHPPTFELEPLGPRRFVLRRI